MRFFFGYLEVHIPVLKPFGKFKIFWELSMLFLTFWNLISFSLVISFDISLQESVSLSLSFLNSENFLNTFQIVCLILYSCDIIIKFNTSFYQGGEAVSERRKIRMNYLKTGFLFDVLGLVPFWQSASASERKFTFYLFFFLFKLYPLHRFFKNINEALLNIEGRLEAIYYLIKLLFKVLIVCHIFACVWHYQAYINEGTAAKLIIIFF